MLVKVQAKEVTDEGRYFKFFVPNKDLSERYDIVEDYFTDFAIPLLDISENRRNFLEDKS